MTSRQHDDQSFMNGVAKGITAGGMMWVFLTQVRGAANSAAVMQYAGTVAASSFIADRLMAAEVLPFESVLEAKRLGMYGLSAASLVEAGIAAGGNYLIYQRVFPGFTPDMQALGITAAIDVAASATAPSVERMITGGA
jgi:hypothetical protein